MRTSHRSASGFAYLGRTAGLVVGLSLGLVSSAAADDGQDANVCTQGRFRCFAHVRTTHDRKVDSHATPQGFGPADLQSAYGIDPARTATVSPTIAIVDAYGYTALEADLGVYRAQFGLPACTVANGCLKIVNQNGQASPLPPNPPANDDWTLETALDVDMASAACPTCKILVVQAQDNLGDGLMIGQNAAASLGAAVISNSWGGPEQPGQSLSEAEGYFVHPGIGIFVAAGDNGYNDAGQGPDYPGTSAHVIAVGGTRLARAQNARGWTETAWTSGGSACSLSIAKPGYQTSPACAYKATTDIAAVGDPQTGLAVYNARNGGWVVVGGTSASAPFVASIFAATGNGAQTSGAFIAQSAAKLNDVTSGSNGACGSILCNAQAGWDGPTGYGTPNATALTAGGGGTGGGGGSDEGGGGGDDSEDPANPSAGPQDLTGGCAASGGGAGWLAGLVASAAMLARPRRRTARRPARDRIG